MIRNIVNNTVFRVFTPLFYGVTMYILILLIFDRVEQLSENFFFIEVILNVTITYLLFEFLRLYILQVERRCPQNCSITNRIIIQGGGSLFISLILTSFVISLYFTKLVGFNTFRTELIVFNTVFLITSILYNMVYFSFFYLNRINVTQLEKEDILRKNVEIELDTFKNKINPDFLYDSLETLISISKKSLDEADAFILKLSEVYRNILSTKNSDLVDVENELKIARVLVELYNYKLNNKLYLNINEEILKKGISIVSGTFVVVVEDIVNRSIISEIQDLKINCSIDNDFIIISHSVQNKLIQVFSKQTEINHLQKAYRYYGKNSLSVHEDDHIRTYHIPFFKQEN